jgi:cytosine/creatinine deaminase
MDAFMQLAIELAKKSLSEGGIPIGSVLVRRGIVMGRGHNKRVQENDPVVHAEIDCLRNAGRISDYRTSTIYSTLMPCYMCAGAIIQFGIKEVVVGESTTFPGALSLMKEHGVDVVDLDMPECKEIMAEFIRRSPEVWNEDIGNV